MIFVEHLARVPNVEIVFGRDAPRQADEPVEGKCARRCVRQIPAGIILRRSSSLSATLRASGDIFASSIFFSISSTSDERASPSPALSESP